MLNAVYCVHQLLNHITSESVDGSSFSCSRSGLNRLRYASAVCACVCVCVCVCGLSVCLCVCLNNNHTQVHTCSVVLSDLEQKDINICSSSIT